MVRDHSAVHGQIVGYEVFDARAPCTAEGGIVGEETCCIDPLLSFSGRRVGHAAVSRDELVSDGPEHLASGGIVRHACAEPCLHGADAMQAGMPNGSIRIAERRRARDEHIQFERGFTDVGLEYAGAGVEGIHRAVAVTRAGSTPAIFA